MQALCEWSRIVDGIDFSNSYAPTIDVDSLRLVIVLATQYGLTLALVDVSNAFQTNDPTKRHYLGIPPLCQK